MQHFSNHTFQNSSFSGFKFCSCCFICHVICLSYLAASNIVNFTIPLFSSCRLLGKRGGWGVGWRNNRFHDGRSRFWNPSSFFPLDFLWAFFCSSIAAWLQCGCVYLCVSLCQLNRVFLVPFVELSFHFKVASIFSYYTGIDRSIGGRKTLLRFEGTSNCSCQRHFLCSCWSTVVVAGLFLIFSRCIFFLYSYTFGTNWIVHLLWDWMRRRVKREYARNWKRFKCWGRLHRLLKM